MENNDHRGIRLRNERSAHDLSQAELGDVIGKKPLAVLNYEKGERLLNQADLEALNAAGFDVWYLITGERTRPDLLSTEQKELLKLWDQVDPSQRATLLTLVRNFAESFGVKK